MIEEEQSKIAEKLTDLLPSFTRKFMRPFTLLMKNITPLHLHVMHILSEKELSTLTELSYEMSMSKQQMTPIINKLHDNGFVLREPDTIDRRSVNLKLTSVGIDSLENIREDLNRIMKRKIECLDENDLHTLHHALDDLFRIIHKIP